MKNIRKIILMLLVVVGLVASMNTLDVKAATAPGSITMKNKSELYKFTGSNAYFGYEFYVKQLTDGTYAYCVSNNDRKVPAGQTLYSRGVNSDKGLDYILKNGWPNKSFTGNNLQDFHITQAAIWEYYDKTRGTNNWTRKGQSFPANSTGLRGYVYSFVQEAIKANDAKEQEPSINVNYNNVMSINKERTYFESAPINVNLVSTKGTYTVAFNNAPLGTIIKDTKGVTKTTFKNGEQFVVYVPANVIKNGQSGTVNLIIKATGVTYKTYYYTTGNGSYQDISPVTSYEITNDLSRTIALNFKKEQTKVQISKQDLTSKEELPGATLEIKDKNGKVIDKWVSTNEPHYIEGLEPGEYTLTETIAPDGYVLSTETITFTVRDDGSVTSVTMFNSKEKTKVKISKQDITSKEELPGATLVIKDKDGKVIDEWVSTNEPHYIEGLEPGEYTLTEKIAPNGYMLSTETIKFTVTEGGDVTSVVMYNAPSVEVPITDMNVSSWTIVIATILITLGTGLVIYHVKYTK